MFVTKILRLQLSLSFKLPNLPNAASHRRPSRGGRWPYPGKDREWRGSLRRFSWHGSWVAHPNKMDNWKLSQFNYSTLIKVDSNYCWKGTIIKLIVVTYSDIRAFYKHFFKLSWWLPGRIAETLIFWLPFLQFVDLRGGLRFRPDAEKRFRGKRATTSSRTPECAHEEWRQPQNQGEHLWKNIKYR